MISIIVPVYNGEVFLNRCVKSILAQTYTDFELVLVDDGSKDNSGKICDEFAAKDCRVKVIHQKNAGVSAARNAGLAMASGEYIGFVDADDYIAPESYEIAMAASADCDIVMWDTVTVWESGKQEADTIPLLAEDTEITKREWYPELLLQMAGSACRCLYRRRILNNVSFPVGIKFSEDRIFNLQAMGNAENIHYLKRGLYFRIMQEESTVHRYHEDYFEACLRSYWETKRTLAVYWPKDEYRLAYCRQFIDGAIGAISNYCYKTSPLPFKERVQKTRQVCRNTELHTVLEICDYGGIRARLIRRECAVLLVLIAKLNNIRRGW
ncbi:MAG: glycosyltransferase [Oscillospiraceae bacterium]|nr:glycosyltransferase [Oscillospiraceae bacterium]